MTDAVRLGLRANLAQFSLLVALNGVVGALAGLERSVLSLVGEGEFGLGSSAAVLAFIAAFGLTKACANLAAGRLADRVEVSVVPGENAVPLVFLDGLAQVAERGLEVPLLRVAAGEQEVDLASAVLAGGAVEVLDGLGDVAAILLEDRGVVEVLGLGQGRARVPPLPFTDLEIDARPVDELALFGSKPLTIFSTSADFSSPFLKARFCRTVWSR